MNCKKCVYSPKCKEIPTDRSGCGDFKDRELFIELPFQVNQIIFYIKPATKYVPVVINEEAYFKLVDDSRVEQTCFNGDVLLEYVYPIFPGKISNVRNYFETYEAAQRALEEMRKGNEY